MAKLTTTLAALQTLTQAQKQSANAATVQSALNMHPQPAAAVSAAMVRYARTSPEHARCACTALRAACLTAPNAQCKRYYKALYNTCATHA